MRRPDMCVNWLRKHWTSCTMLPLLRTLVAADSRWACAFPVLWIITPPPSGDGLSASRDNSASINGSTHMDAHAHTLQVLTCLQGCSHPHCIHFGSSGRNVQQQLHPHVQGRIQGFGNAMPPPSGSASPHGSSGASYKLQAAANHKLEAANSYGNRGGFTGPGKVSSSRMMGFGNAAFDNPPPPPSLAATSAAPSQVRGGGCGAGLGEMRLGLGMGNGYWQREAWLDCIKCCLSQVGGRD